MNKIIELPYNSMLSTKEIMSDLTIDGISQPKEIFSIFKDECEKTYEQLSSINKSPLSQTDEIELKKTLSLLHRLKGSSGFLGFEKIRSLAHDAENATQKIPFQQGSIDKLNNELRRIITLIEAEL